MKSTCLYCNSKNIIKIEYDFHDAYKCKDCNLAFYEEITECCRNPIERYVNDYHDNIPKFIRIQCDNCGGCLNMKKSLKRAQFGHKTRGEFSKEKFTNWKEDKRSESQEIFIFIKHLEFISSNYYLHRTHLQSEYWKNIRKLVLERDKGTCQLCKREPARDVHHLTYKNLGNETLDELISYCRVCHGKVHNK